MSEMIERVARAVCVQAGFNPDEIMTNNGPRWSYYVSGAQVSIEAMREATFQMLIEGQGVVNLSEEVGRFEYISRDECQEIWGTMIDEALK